MLWLYFYDVHYLDVTQTFDYQSDVDVCLSVSEMVIIVR